MEEEAHPFLLYTWKHLGLDAEKSPTQNEGGLQGRAPPWSSQGPNPDTQSHALPAHLTDAFTAADSQQHPFHVGPAWDTCDSRSIGYRRAAAQKAQEELLKCTSLPSLSLSHCKQAEVYGEHH